MRASRAALQAIGLYIVWVVLTYLLEGRPQTLLQPEAAGLRLGYALVVNILVGILAAMFVVRVFVRTGVAQGHRLGFGSLRRTLFTVLAGIALGFGAYVVQGAPSLHPIVVANGFAQVLVVSIAEVLVCWVVIGGALSAGLYRYGFVLRSMGLVLIPALLFGLYHLAHSPPFNSLQMVGLLTVVGTVTGVFYLISRDVYGTIVLHNFLALFGVLQAVQQSVGLEAYEQPRMPLLLTGLAAVAVLAGSHARFLASESALAGGRNTSVVGA